MLEKSGSTTSVQGLLSVAHMELRSTGEGQTRQGTLLKLLLNVGLWTEQEPGAPPGWHI